MAEQYEDIDALGQLEHGDIVEIEPGKFCMVKDDESQSKIELMKIQGKIDYGDLDQSAPVDANVKVCTEIQIIFGSRNIIISTFGNNIHSITSC